MKNESLFKNITVQRKKKQGNCLIYENNGYKVVNNTLKYSSYGDKLNSNFIMLPKMATSK